MTSQAANWCLHPAVVLFFSLVLLKILSVCQTAAHSNHCNEICGFLKVPFPFGISSACGLNQFKLTCIANSTLMLSLNTHNYQVLSFTHNSTIIDPLLSNCTEAHFAFSDFELAGTYAVSKRNFLILYSCQNVTYCPSNCSFSELPQSPCANLSSSCCYDLNYAEEPPLHSIGFTSLGCKSFTSWVTDYQLDNQTQLTVEAHYGLELDWVIPGNCATSVCKSNANCVNGATLSGYTCQCAAGFVGDPYINGSGCRPDMCDSTEIRSGCVCPNGHVATKDGCRSHSAPTRIIIIITGILVGATVFSVFLIALAILRRRSANLRKGRNSALALKHIEELLTTSSNASTITIFAYKDLEKATKGFSQSQMLGHGAHGIVYAGRLQDGSSVAVKKINKINQHGVEHVINELTVLSSVKHKNLVQLLGCCLEVQDPLLVYEFVPYGTLAEHLQKERGDGLDWITRIAIATEAAQALAYLHSEITPPIYHRDVKSTNILLDFEYNTKVADFGLSKLVLTDASHISTVPQGTPGYLDPEYHQNFCLTDKSDVYSYGVVLIEMITALKVVDFTRDKREVNLAALALTKIANGTLDEVVDSFLEIDKQPQVRCMIQRVAELAFRCLSFDKNARPSMLEVAEELEQIKMASIFPGDQSPIRPLNLQDTCTLLPR
ncbi:hypothetical protein O6H91_20G048300 [Diphasiastrum complanatum]|uniref:Uncharacterized protein n=2 Tax=Diphasiastrum complanatum TaxID=34168 RepID=A0ACC2AQ80_DIPCM|nr:hypothetical protein O6H91_20G048300 [Diphasiastrum complanatum]KAJ7519646.1 hypothetical protein O6H91_20G048300 [Diphasiastrum complanatum]